MKNEELKKGFTLVELVIVIAVIAILSGVLVPTFSNVIKSAKESSIYQQVVNAQKELITPNGFLPEDTIGLTIVLDDTYFQILENFSLLKTSRKTRTGLVHIETPTISNPNIVVYKMPVFGVDILHGMIYRNDSGELIIVNFDSKETEENFSNYFTSTSSGIQLKSEYTNRITTVALPDNVTKLNANAFANCTNLESVLLNTGVTHLGNYAFSQCSNLKSINLPNSLENIGHYVFKKCTSLKTVNFPNTISNWGTNTFEDCYSLESVNIPSGATKVINNYTFRNCRGLKTVTLGDSIESINSQAFYSCYSLKTLNLPSNTGSLTTIGNSAFANCYSLENVVLPTTVNNLGDSAFHSCYSLVNINLPDSITEIKSSTFYMCKKLKQITLPNYLTIIGNYAFNSCYTLTTINVPASLTSTSFKGSEIFSNCHRLFEVFNYSSTNINPVSTTMGNIAKNANIIHKITIDGENVTDVISYKIYNQESVTHTITRNYVQSMLIEQAGICYWILDDDNANLHRKVAVGLTDPDSRELILANDCNQIKKWAFAACPNLVKIVIPSSVQYMDERLNGIFKDVGTVYEFYNLTVDQKVFDYSSNSYKNIAKLQGLNIVNLYTSADTPSKITLIDHVYYYNNAGQVIAVNTESTAYSEITLIDTCTSIRANAFKNNVFITSISIPASVKSIGNYAFEYCYGLSTVTMEEGLVSIGTSAFYYCSALARVELPNSVTSLGDSAFRYCTNRETVILGDNITSLPSTVFDHSNIDIIFVDVNLTNIASNAFDNATVGAIYYKGSESQWNNITNNDALLSVSSEGIYFYSEVAKAGCWHYVNGIATLWV